MLRAPLFVGPAFFARAPDLYGAGEFAARDFCTAYRLLRSFPPKVLRGKLEGNLFHSFIRHSTVVHHDILDLFTLSSPLFTHEYLQNRNSQNFLKTNDLGGVTVTPNMSPVSIESCIMVSKGSFREMGKTKTENVFFHRIRKNTFQIKASN